MDLTKEQKEAILNSNGWTTLWSPDNWIKKEWLERKVFNVDLAGRSLEDAFKQCMQDLRDVEIMKESKRMYEEHLEKIRTTKG